MSRFARRFSVVLLVCSFLAASGCLDYESSVTLNKDMTGKATFRMALDLEPFMMSIMQAAGGGTGGPPPEEMMSMMKTQMAEELGKGMFDVEQLKSKLPEGVTLLDSAQKADGMKVTFGFTFGFKDITKLPLIEVPPPAQAAAATGGKAQEPLKPFEFTVTDDGSTITIATKDKPAEPAKPVDEKAKAEAAAALKDATSAMDMSKIADMLKGVKIKMTMKFDIPQTVIEQNATRKEGTAYIWEMSLDMGSMDLASMGGPGTMPEPPKVKLKFKK